MNLLSQFKNKLTFDYVFYVFLLLFLFSLPLSEGIKANFFISVNVNVYDIFNKKRY